MSSLGGGGASVGYWEEESERRYGRGRSGYHLLNNF